ncbi:MAG: hypothetical protein ABI237_11000 [Ginsengibacter sp.]
MLQKNEITKIYDTVLSIPGMNQSIKVSLQISRKNLLLLNKVIEKGLYGKEADDKSVSMLEMMSKETLEELSGISTQLLEKAGLVEMNEKLKSF